MCVSKSFRAMCPPLSQKLRNHLNLLDAQETNPARKKWSKLLLAGEEFLTDLLGISAHFMSS